MKAMAKRAESSQYEGADGDVTQILWYGQDGHDHEDFDSHENRLS